MAQIKGGEAGEAGDPWSGVRVSRSMLSDSRWGEGVAEMESYAPVPMEG